MFSIRPIVLALALGFTTTLGVVSLAGAQQATTVNLTTENNSGISGTTTLTDLGGGKTRVEVRVNGAGAGPQPVHIHEGACATLNPQPKYPLTAVTNGVSMTEVNVSLQDLTSAPYAINLHKSPQEVPVYVACGNIAMAAQTGAATQPTNLPRAGDAGSLAPLAAGAFGFGVTLLGAGYAALRRARR